MGEKIIQPPFYNSGFYNTVSGGGGGDEIRNLIYYTYFTTNDVNNDNAKIGATVNYQNTSIVSDTINNFNTSPINFLKYNTAASASSFITSINKKIYSVELFQKSHSVYGSSGPQFGLWISSHGFSCIKHSSGSYVVIDGGFEIIELYNGVTQFSTKQFKIPTSLMPANDVVSHFSFVVKDDILKVFSNGTILFKMKLINLLDPLNLRLARWSPDSSCYINLTNIAVWDIDKTEGGNIYPVPEDVYI